MQSTHKHQNGIRPQFQSFACAKLVNHIHQASGLGTFSSLAAMHLFQKEVIFTIEAIRNSSAVALSYAQLDGMMKNNTDLTDKLSVEHVRYEKKTFNLNAMIFEVKSSLVEKDSELNSSVVELASRKDACFRLKCKNVDISLSYGKLLARFDAYHKSAEQSKCKAIINAYNLGYLDCKNGSASLHASKDEDIKTFCPNLLSVRSGQVNVAGMVRVEMAVIKDDKAEDDATDEMMADVAEQASGAVNFMVDQVNAKEFAYQGPSTGVSE